jgi:hypothetical protein
MSPAVITKGKDGKMYPNPRAAREAGKKLLKKFMKMTLLKMSKRLLKFQLTN